MGSAVSLDVSPLVLGMHAVSPRIKNSIRVTILPFIADINRVAEQARGVGAWDTLAA